MAKSTFKHTVSA